MELLHKRRVYQVCFALALSGCSVSTAPSSNPSPGPPPSSALPPPAAPTPPELQTNYQNDPSLTRGEKVKRMDRALSRSLNTFDDRRNAAAQDGGRPSSVTAGNATGSSDMPEASLGGSIASSEISGTEVLSQVPGGPAVGTPPLTDVTGVDPALGIPPTSDGMEAPNRNPTRILGRQPVPGSGQLPKDIPAADNDSVLEAQIRAAAMQEQDPQMRERLWNEYRRYKGLPLKE